MLPAARVRVPAGWPSDCTAPLPRGSNRCQVWAGPPWITRPSGATAIWPNHCRPAALLAAGWPFSAFCSSSRSCMVAPVVRVHAFVAGL